MNLVMAIQNLTLGDLGNVLSSTRGSKKRRDSYRDEWLEYLKLQNVYCLLDDPAGEEIRKNMENAATATWPNSSFLDKQPFGSHVTFNTTTTLGFSAQILERAYGRLKPHLAVNAASKDRTWWADRDAVVEKQLDRARLEKKNRDRVYLVRHWTKKAGHTDSVIAALNPKGAPDRGFAMSSGRRDFWFECTRGRKLGFDKVSSREVVRRVLTSSLDVTRWAAKHPSAGEESAGVLGVISTLGFQMPSVPSPRATLLGHACADQFRKGFVLGLGQIEAALQHSIRPMRIPKVTAEALLNATALYNQGVEDNFLFSSFLELGPYVRRIWERLLAHSRYFLSPEDFAPGTILGGIADRLNVAVPGPVVSWVTSKLSRSTRLLLQEYQAGDGCSAELAVALAADLNRLLSSTELLTHLKLVFGGSATETEISLPVDALGALDVMDTNRRLLNINFGSGSALGKNGERVETGADSDKRRSLSLSRFAGGFSQMVSNFETGWRNRYHGGWGLGDVSDFNLEFKGGVQQLTTAFDGAYKRLSWYFTGDSRTLAVITGTPGVHTIAGAVELNFFDIFKPEFFAARAAHEAGETLLHVPTIARAGEGLRCQLSPEGLVHHAGIMSLITGADRESTLRARKRTGMQLAAIQKAAAAANAPKFLRKILFPPSGSCLLFDQVYADICNFNTVFLGKNDLYSFWWLASFATDPENWNTDGRVDTVQAREALLRAFLAMRADSKLSDDFIWQSIEKYWRHLKKHGVDDGVRAEAFECGKKLSGIAEYAAWLEHAVTLGKHGLPALRRQREVVDAARSVFPARGARPGARFDFDFLNAYAEPRAKMARELLEQGRGFPGGQHRASSGPFDPNGTTYPFEADRWFDFCDTVALMHGYLTLLKEESNCENSNHTGRDLVLERQADGSPVKIRTNCPELLFDPRGGTFTTSASFRRKYLKWRCAFVMSLLGITEKAKLVQCREHLWHQGS
jgi:hypothetical protein